MSNSFLFHRFLSTRDRLVRGIGSELRPRGCAAQAADEVPVRRMGMIDELASAVRTRGHLQHVGLEKTQERPCAGDAQDRFQSDCPDLVEVEPIGGDERHDALPFRTLRGPVVQVHEERGMEVWLPFQEPLGGKRKKSPRGCLLADLTIEPSQALTRQCRLCLEHLHSGPQANELAGQKNLFGVVFGRSRIHISAMLRFPGDPMRQARGAGCGIRRRGGSPYS